MRDFVVLSHGVGVCRDMLKISCSRTLAWCKKHDLDFRASTRREAPGCAFWWDKPAFMRRVLKECEDGTELTWIDADGIVVQTDVSPRGVLPAVFDLGMRFMDNHWAAPGVQYFQTGVIFVRNTANLRTLVDEWFDMRTQAAANVPGIPPAYDEWAMTRLLEHTGFPVFHLPGAWNSFREDEYPIIRAFHGWDHGRVLEKLRDECCTSVRRLKIKEG